MLAQKTEAKSSKLFALQEELKAAQAATEKARGDAAAAKARALVLEADCKRLKGSAHTLLRKSETDDRLVDKLRGELAVAKAGLAGASAELEARIKGGGSVGGGGVNVDDHTREMAVAKATIAKLKEHIGVLRGASEAKGHHPPPLPPSSALEGGGWGKGGVTNPNFYATSNGNNSAAGGGGGGGGMGEGGFAAPMQYFQQQALAAELTQNSQAFNTFTNQQQQQQQLEMAYLMQQQPQQQPQQVGEEELDRMSSQYRAQELSLQQRKEDLLLIQHNLQYSGK
jgi:hypothetical protein